SANVVIDESASMPRPLSLAEEYRLVRKAQYAVTCVTLGGGQRISPYHQPSLHARAQRADGLDVVDDLAGHRRRIGGGGYVAGVAEHDVAVAAAAHEVVDGDPIDPGLVERRIADPDQCDAASGRAPHVGLDLESRELRETAGRTGKLRQPVLDRGLELAP